MSYPTEGSGALRSSQRFKYSDYKTWPEGERWELIGGEAFSLSPAPRVRHQDLLLALSTQLQLWFKGKNCRPYVAPVDVFWPSKEDQKEDEVDTVTQPDLFVLCDSSKRHEYGIRGAPDFIIEILSPSTAYKDETQKLRLHEKHKVKEYWIVNPDTLEAFLYILKSDGLYGLPRVASLAHGVPVETHAGLSLRVTEQDLSL